MKSPKTFEELRASGFLVKSGIIAGEECYLVIPEAAVATGTWSADTLIYRSSIWTKEGELVSPSFPKFFNIFESSDVVRDPTDADFSDMKILEKLDGSTLVLSKFKGELIHRTRGTFNAELLPNGSEIAQLKIKYPKAFDNKFINDGDRSLIFEWTTPSNKIILDYGDEPVLTLIGAVRHSDYRLIKQYELDYIADAINVPRPKVYSFNKLDELISTVEQFKGEEGVVLYFDDEQKLKKVKGLEYLKLHRFKSNATIKNVTEMFFDGGFHTIAEYREYIKTQFDYECFAMVEAYVAKVYKYYMDAKEIIRELDYEITPLKVWSRKDAALKILADHKEDGLSGYCFELLGNKEINVDKYKKLVYSLMEKDGEIK